MRHFFVFGIFLTLLYSCQQSFVDQETPIPLVLKSINLVDQNGFSETVTSEDRLEKYACVDFLQPQPYQKVLRIYGRDPDGHTHACINSYYPNGQPKQYLEIVNNRAQGEYREWHSNGQLLVEANVVGGEPDIDAGAEKTWLFNGLSRAWDEDGNLIAEIPYNFGELEGESIYYHKNGSIWKTIPCSKGCINGIMKIYLVDGSLLQKVNYEMGMKQGLSERYWPNGIIAANEFYKDDKLNDAQYFDLSGICVCMIEEGNGYKALFGKDGVNELHQYSNGIQEGEIKIFNTDGTLAKLYHVKNELKDGEEIEYFPLNEVAGEHKPRMTIEWVEGYIQGKVKTWYPNGTQESQREMSQNKKNGLLTAWYENGRVMLIEEYDHDKLINGEYFLPGEKTPISMVKSGKGIVTLFDSKGNFLRKVAYQNSKPIFEKG